MDRSLRGRGMDQFYLLMAKQYNMLYRFNTLYINSYIQEKWQCRYLQGHFQWMGIIREHTRPMAPVLIGPRWLPKRILRPTKSKK